MEVCNGWLLHDQNVKRYRKKGILKWVHSSLSDTSVLLLLVVENRRIMESGIAEIKIFWNIMRSILG